MTGVALHGDVAADAAACAPVWAGIAEAVARLPAKPARSPAQAAEAARLLGEGRALRERFLARHVVAVYDALTGTRQRFVRVEHLVPAAAALLPGLGPSAEQLAAEAALDQRDKDGWEIDHGVLLSHILADPACGRHLCHAMLLPRPEALALLPHLARDGVVALPSVTVRRDGRAAVVTTSNPRFLNAEDEATLDEFETAVDLATLDPATEAAVLRGAVVQHAKYAGRRVFNAGINLTHLYRGRISLLWYLRRDLGVVNKLYRGVAVADAAPDEWTGSTREKPWIAAVDTFAIGGGCQLLLAMDYVLAAEGAYMTLPARKEGIIPGAANLRLPRFVGDRLARQLIAYGRGLDCGSPEGRLICDEIAPPAEMDAAVARVVERLTGAGIVSFAGNRRAFRVAQEPLDTFRAYMATYAREQAACHFSPALIANLEQHWRAADRRA